MISAREARGNAISSRISETILEEISKGIEEASLNGEFRYAYNVSDMEPGTISAYIHRLEDEEFSVYLNTLRKTKTLVIEWKRIISHHK